MSDSEKLFESTFGNSPEYTAFTPYRVCPLGAHTDHNLGKITGFAIDKGVRIAYSPTADGAFECVSAQFDGVKKWRADDVPSVRQNDWADHLRGAMISLQRKAPVRYGLRLAVNGELPIGGLSSSAAVIISFMNALCRVNDIEISSAELVDYAQWAENKYVGVSCGKLDQSCEVYCRKDSLLYMDMLDCSHEVIRADSKMEEFEIAVFFSGLTRSLSSTKYNMRADEARAAAYSLLAFGGIEYGKFADTNLRDVPVDIYNQYRCRLPDSLRKRADHWFSECARVEDGVEAWRRGDIVKFGRLVNESGKSSVENWETGCPELVSLYNIMCETDGIYGGRFSGAGIKGCTMAIIDPTKREFILENVREKYLAMYPELSENYTACICKTADGVVLP